MTDAYILKRPPFQNYQQTLKNGKITVCESAATASADDRRRSGTPIARYIHKIISIISKIATGNQPPLQSACLKRSSVEFAGYMASKNLFYLGYVAFYIHAFSDILIFIKKHF
jgi:hypothetical protein